MTALDTRSTSGAALPARELVGVGLAVVAGGALVVGGLGLLVLLVVGLLVAGVSSSLDRFVGGVPGLGLLPPAIPSAGAAAPALRQIPAEQLATMQQVGASSPCHVPWTVPPDSEFHGTAGPQVGTSRGRP